MVMAAVIGGTGLLSAGIQSSAASSAAKAQTNAANQANATQQQMYNQTRSDLSPYNQGGQAAYSTLNNLLGVGGNSSTMQSTLEGLPGYQFTLDQGLKSTQSGYAARGLADSGGALKGAANYATGLANTNYGNYVNQLQNSANLGELAAAQTGDYGTQTATQQGQNTIGAGNAQGAASVASGNAFANNASNSLGGYLYSLNNNLLGGSSGGGASQPLGPNQLTNWFGT